jgi:hypothetical protein
VRWPWVNRERLTLMRLQLEGEIHRAVVAEERAKHLAEVLEKCDAERREMFLRILRLSQGLPIFPDGVTPVQEETPAETVRVLNFAGMTEPEIDAELTRVAVSMGMRDAGRVTRFIEQQKTVYFREADRAKMTREDEELREQALRAMDESIQQGRADAQRSS